MRHLLKVMLMLAALFALTFVAARATGILTEDNVRLWLEQASTASPAWIAALVVLLLFIDLFVAVPTLTVTILAGYFLGFAAGLAASFTGMALAVGGGYGICRLYGEGLIARIVRDEEERRELAAAFQRNGPAMVLLARAVPILPEVTACLAGATRMPPLRYALFFTLGTLPYAAVAAYAGSVSTLDDPRPAIYAALGLYAVMWTGWALFRRRRKRAAVAAESR